MVQGLVLECLKAEDPSRCIHEFTQRLVKDHGWLQAEADEVAETAVRVWQTVGPHIMPPSDQS